VAAAVPPVWPLSWPLSASAVWVGLALWPFSGAAGVAAEPAGVGLVAGSAAEAVAPPGVADDPPLAPFEPDAVADDPLFEPAGGGVTAEPGSEPGAVPGVTPLALLTATCPPVSFLPPVN